MVFPFIYPFPLAFGSTVAGIGSLASFYQSASHGPHFCKSAGNIGTIQANSGARRCRTTFAKCAVNTFAHAGGLRGFFQDLVRKVAAVHRINMQSYRYATVRFILFQLSLHVLPYPHVLADAYHPLGTIGAPGIAI